MNRKISLCFCLVSVLSGCAATSQNLQTPAPMAKPESKAPAGTQDAKHEQTAGSLQSVSLSNFGTVAKVNGVKISSDIFERNFEEFLRENNINVGSIRYPQRFKQYKKELLEMLVNAELVWQAADSNNIQVADSEIQQLVDNVRSQFDSQQAFEQRLSTEGYTPQSYRRHLARLAASKKYLDHLPAVAQVVDAQAVHVFYEQNREKFNLPEMVHARHILLKTSPDMDQAGRAKLREQLQQLLLQLNQGQDFSTLAQQYSQDSSAQRGGDLGFFPRGVMVGSFEDTVFSLEVGQVSQVFETKFGFHIVKLLAKREAEIVPEAQVAERIAAMLQAQKRQGAINEEVSRLRAQAQIEIFLSL